VHAHAVVARLDPLASRELLRLLMEGAAEIGSAVVVATRVLTDIERVCERVVLLGDGHVRLDTPSGLSAGGTAWADIGFSALAGGNLDLASTVFQKGLKTPTMFQLYMRPRHLLGLALVALAQERFDEAARLLGEARTYAEERGMRHFYAPIALAEAQMATAQGDHRGALAACDRAQATAQELELRPALLAAHLAAAQALAALGRAAEAAVRLTLARAVADDIAAGIDDPDMRAKYLTNHPIGLS